MTTEDPGLAVILRTHSDIEASVVRSLLETQDIAVLVASDVPHAVLPLSIGGLGEVRLTVRQDQADAASRLIADYRRGAAASEEEQELQLDRCEAALGYTFRDKWLLEHALTHRSRAHEDRHGDRVDNESLEFLGDAVLGLVISDRLFREFPEWDEGQKSKARSQLVSGQTLARAGEQIDLGAYLLLGRGEEKTGGRWKASLLANTFEAVIAAIYLDGGLPAAEQFIDRIFGPALDAIRVGRAAFDVMRDYKSDLQEWVHAHGHGDPTYTCIAERGPKHDRTFEVRLEVDTIKTRARGRSKKEAEQQAAALALVRLRKSLDAP